MPRIDTSTLNQAAIAGLPDHVRRQIYNGLDCCVTFEVFEKLSAELRQQNDPSARMVYDFERGMQAPAMDMMLRGWRVDPYERSNGIKLLESQRSRLEWVLNCYAHAVWGKNLNANSSHQLKEFFYKVMKLPEQFKNEKGVKKVSTNREALENLSGYFLALPIINCILAIREVVKKLSVLRSEVDPDSRMRTSYNVAGTETGRWSSSSNSTGGGTNLQNITEELRKMFISDEGYKLAYVDLEQAESRVVGLLVLATIGDPGYLDACESGDLHTTVARLVWPSLGWTGDKKKDKEIAEQPFYRHFSYRDMAKRGGHGTNYYGTPRTMSKHLKVTERVMADFQCAYFTAFPGIPKWHRWVAHQLGVHQEITTPLGRRRIFFGRPGDDATLREAIAFCPQSVVGDLLNVALWRVWKFLPEVQLLGQIHDAIVFQYPEDREVELMSRALELTRVPVTLGNRTLIIPSEAKVGWNWASQDKKPFTPENNPNGLKKWKGQPDDRRRVTGLDRVIS